MGVRVDHAWEDETTPRVDLTFPTQIDTDRGDPLAVDRNIDYFGSRRRHDGTPADDEVV